MSKSGRLRVAWEMLRSVVVVVFFLMEMRMACREQERNVLEQSSGKEISLSLFSSQHYVMSVFRLACSND